MVITSSNVRHRAEAEADTSSAQSDRRVPISFRITHRALNVFLVIRGENGHAQMCSQMEPLGDDRWVLRLPLRPGRYRYRYYAIHERVTTYVAPGDVESDFPDLDEPGAALARMAEVGVRTIGRDQGADGAPGRVVGVVGQTLEGIPVFEG